MLFILNSLLGVDLYAPVVDALGTYLINPIRLYMGYEYIYMPSGRQTELLKKSLAIAESTLLDSFAANSNPSDGLEILTRGTNCYYEFYKNRLEGRLSFISFSGLLNSLQSEELLTIEDRQVHKFSSLFRDNCSTKRDHLVSTADFGRYRNHSKYRDGLYCLVDYANHTDSIYRNSLEKISRSIITNTTRLDNLSTKVRGLLWLVQFNEQWPTISKDFCDYKNSSKI
jgi:hypothetical protein